MTDLPAIVESAGPGASILFCRFRHDLTSLLSILQELGITEFHIYSYADKSASIYMTVKDGSRLGGHLCGVAGALQSDGKTAR